MRLAVLILGLVVAGCAGEGPLRDQRSNGEMVELSETPFFSDDSHHAAPAALATMLAASGAANVDTGQLAREIYPRKSKAPETERIADAARRHGRVPYLLKPEIATLLRQLDAGQPVMVAQGGGLFSSTHYAVLIGYNPDKDEMILRDGTERRKVVRSDKFMNAWKGGKFWSILTAVPDAIPVGAEQQVWLDAVQPLENLHRPELAAEAYGAASRRWPRSDQPWRMLGEVRRGQHDLDGAEEALRAALARVPSVAAYDDLAQVLVDEGCPAAATRAVDAAAQQQSSAADKAQIEKTRQFIAAHGGTSVPGCPAN